MATQPSKQQLEDARAFLRKRLDAQSSMHNNVESLIYNTAKDILAISVKYNIPPRMFRFSADKNLNEEVNAVIRKLKQQIEEDTFTLAVADHEDKDGIIAYITREIHDKTFYQRNGIYTNRLKYELEGAITAGLILGASTAKILSAIKTHLKHPYSNPMIIDAIEMGGASAVRLKNGGVSYGVGRTTSMTTALVNLSSFAIAEGWGWYSLQEAIKNGAVGFYTFRGSSFPCATCDEYTRYLHPLTDTLPPLHLNCVCGYVFV